MVPPLGYRIVYGNILTGHQGQDTGLHDIYKAWWNSTNFNLLFENKLTLTMLNGTRCNKSNCLSRCPSAENNRTIVLSWWILMHWAGCTLFCCCIVVAGCACEMHAGGLGLFKCFSLKMGTQNSLNVFLHQGTVIDVVFFRCQRL